MDSEQSRAQEDVECQLLFTSGAHACVSTSLNTPKLVVTRRWTQSEQMSPTTDMLALGLGSFFALAVSWRMCTSMTVFV